MLLQKLGDGESIEALALDTKTERLESANEEEGCFGIHGAAEVDNHVTDASHPLFASGGDSRDNVRMAGKIFSGAVNDISKPSSMGFCRSGVAKVLSMIEMRLCFLAKAIALLRLTRRSVGFVGVST